jgi:hypothetical protein
MSDINLSHVSRNLFVALMLFLAGFSTFSLLDLPHAGVVFFVVGFLFVTFAFAPARPEQENQE